MAGNASRRWWNRLTDRLTGARQVEALNALRSEIAQLGTELRQLRREAALVLGPVHDGLAGSISQLNRSFDEAGISSRRNIRDAMERLAVLDSARLAEQEMVKASTFGHPHHTLAHALSLAPRGGLALEFGVYSGKTLRLIAEARGDGRVYGFDSFEGLPEAWRTDFPAGAFAAERLPQIDNAELVVGWFDKTLPGFLAAHPGTVDFLHVDCDLYSSTVTIFDWIGPRLRPGSVVVFDEFFNYTGWQAHEFKAWSEYASRTGTRYTYEAYTFNNEQVALRILETPER